MTSTDTHDDGIFPVTFIRPMREIGQVNEHLAKAPIEHNHIGLQKLRRFCLEIFKQNKVTESRLDPNDTIGDVLFPGLRYCGIRPYFVTHDHRHAAHILGPVSCMIATTPTTPLKIITPRTTSVNHYGVSLGTVSSEVLYNGLLESEKQPTTRENIKKLTIQARAKRDVDWLLFAYVTEIRDPGQSQQNNYVTVTVHAIANPPVELVLLERPFNTLHDSSWLFIPSVIPPAYRSHLYEAMGKYLKKEAEQRAEALGLMSLHRIPPAFSSRHGSHLEYLFSPDQ